MGTAETRSKKKVQLWKKAIFHFILCFVMGFFTGFAPMGKPSFFSNLTRTTGNVSLQTTQPAEVPKPGIFTDGSPETVAKTSENEDMERLKLFEDEQKNNNAEEDRDLVPRTPLIVVTPTSSRNMFKEVWLRRLANTMRLVPQPLLWIIVEGQYDDSSVEVTEILRKSGIMYRFLVSKQNFTDPNAEVEYMRNIALRHIEHHRLGGIVHFAEVTDVYDLEFFDELREIGVLGTWPVALVSGKRKKVGIEGPVCGRGGRVIGWHLQRRIRQGDEDDIIIDDEADDDEVKKSLLRLSNFAFNTSILWDPERWGRPSSSQSTSQEDPMKFVKEAIVEDETKLKGIPGRDDCARLLQWRLQSPSFLSTR